MSLLQNTADKVERFSLEVANKEMEKLRSEMNNLRHDLDGKVDLGLYFEMLENINDANHISSTIIRKLDHDRSCMINALTCISQILLGMFAQGVKVTNAEKDQLLGLQAEINELQTHNKYYYGESNRTDYY